MKLKLKPNGDVVKDNIVIGKLTEPATHTLSGRFLVFAPYGKLGIGAMIKIPIEVDPLKYLEKHFISYESTQI